MSAIHDDSTPETDASTTCSDPFSIGNMDTASETSKPATDASPDCHLRPTAALDDSGGELQEGMDQLAETALSVAQEAVDGLEAAAEYVRTTGWPADAGHAPDVHQEQSRCLPDRGRGIRVRRGPLNQARLTGR